MPRIAVLRALQLGDLLVAVPALRSLRRRFPDAHVALIGLPWAREFVARYGAYVDEHLEFPGWPGIPEAPFDAHRARTFLAEQRSRPFDLALQMHGSGGTSNQFVNELGATRSVGWGMPGQPRLLTLQPTYPSDAHEIDRNLLLVGLLGGDVHDRDLELPISPAERDVSSALLVGLRRPLIGVHAGARDRARRWPAARFALVATTLARRFGGSVVLTGTRREERLACAIAARIGAPARVVAGRTSLGELGAVIASLDLLITNDTGASHVSVATGTPSVVVWGSADIARWAPLDRARHPVVYDTRGIRAIGAPRVLAIAEHLMRVRAAA